MTVSGTWVNSYGSTMNLAQDGNGAISGVYKSSTGSTGVYNVLGYAMKSPATPTLGEAFAISIFWRSTAGGPGDQSWHWVSGLSGQVVASGTTAQTLNLIHCMVATDAFPGLAQIGSYLDKLVYQSTPVGGGTIASALAHPALRQAAAVVANPINGTWVCTTNSQITLTLSLTNATPGQVAGTLTYGNGAYVLNGFTDSFAQSAGLPLQSLAVTARVDGEGSVVSLSGSWDQSTQLLSLTELLSVGTPNSSTYVQTTVDKLVFTKAG
jgi:saccharopepsin